MASRYPVNMLPQQQSTGRHGVAQQAAPAFFYSPQPLYSGYPAQLTPQQLFALQQQQQQQQSNAQPQSHHIFVQQHNAATAAQSYQQTQSQQFVLAQQQQQQAAAAALLQHVNAGAAASPTNHPQMGTPPQQHLLRGTAIHAPHGGGLPVQQHPGSKNTLPAQAAPGSPMGGGADALANKGKLEVDDEYGLQPLLRVIMPQPAMLTMPSLAQPGEEVDAFTGRTLQQHTHDQANFICVTRGFDLSQLGLQVSQHEQLHPTVATLPLDEHQYYVLPDFKIPDCYKKPKPKPLSMKSFSCFKEETLFYIFYSMPRDVLHLAAARALYERGWRYHKWDQQWFRPALHAADGSYIAHNTPEAAAAVPLESIAESYRGQQGVRAFVGTYEIFDPTTWRINRTAAGHVVLVADVEEHTVLQAAMEEAARQQQLKQQQAAQQRAPATTTATAPAPAGAGDASPSTHKH